MADLYENTFFTFTWKIKNINFYKKMDTDLTSPSFKVGRTDFQFFLKSGNWSTKSISLRVLNLPISELPFFCPQSKLTLLRDDGEVLERYETLATEMFSKFDYSFPKPALFTNEKVLLTFLRQDTLIIRWEAYSFGSGYYIFRTIFHQKTINWEIDDFSKATTFTKSFQLSSLYFTLELQHNHSTNIIKVKIFLENVVRLHLGNCTIAVVDENNIHHCEVNLPFEKNIRFWADPVMNEAIMLDENVCSLIKNDMLTLHWELTFGIGNSWCGRGPQTKCQITIPQSKDNIERSITTQASSSTLQRDLLRLYQDSKFCDVIIKAGHAFFPVHKIILCARSPVFCTMFENKTEESRTGVVHIPDMKQETLILMMQFLYTDSLGDISWEVASELYDAATKYRILSLKEKCLCILREKLSVNNACKALVFAIE